MGERAVAWLAQRGAAVPPALQAHMVTAAASVADEPSLPDTLSRAALACLREAVALGDARAAALPLLAADALVTWAAEAVSDEDASHLERLAQTWAPAKLARVLESGDHA